MPLKHDGNYRGPHASHVSRSKKLGKHKTVITAAMPLVDSLLGDEQVTTVHLGKVVGSGKFVPRSVCEVLGSNIKVLLVAHDCAQAFTIEAKDTEAALKLAEVIKVRWANITKGGPQIVAT